MKKIYTILHHNFVIFAKSPALLLILIMPVSLLFVLGSIKPVAWILPNIVSLSIIIICFLSVGVQYNEYRKTNFFRYSNSTFIRTPSIIIGTFLVVFATSLIFSLFLMVLTWFFTLAAPILQQTIDNIRLDGLSAFQPFLKDQAFFSTFTFSGVHWIAFFYSLIVTTLMSSLFAILLCNIITNIKTYMMTSILYIVAFVLLSGMTVPLSVIVSKPFLAIFADLMPNYHTNIMLTQSINTSFTLTVDDYSLWIEGVGDWIQLINQNYVSNGNNAMNALLEAGVPTLNGKDPLDISLIYAMFPFLPAATTFISDVLAVIMPGWSSVSTGTFPFLYLVTFVFAATDGMFPFTFGDLSMGMGNIFVSLGETIKALYPFGNVFSLTILNSSGEMATNWFGITTNIMPYLVMLLSIPTFAKVVRY